MTAFIKPGVYRNVVDISESPLDLTYKVYSQEEIDMECFQMFTGARALGFPDKVKPLFECTVYKIRYKVPKFQSNIQSMDFGTVRVLGEDIMKIEPIHLLLILMKMFYNKEWNGTEWIEAENELLSCKMNEYDDQDLDEIVNKLAEEMAKDIDKQIIEDLLCEQNKR